MHGLKPGDRTTRVEMQKIFGGGLREGIVPSTTTPYILIYIDHDSGAGYGYEDGWLAEEDELGPVFEYTGRGGRGDQTFLKQAGSRNKAILRHVEEGRSLLLFIAEGVVPGSRSAAKQQRYLGEFAIDAAQPYTIREGNDQDGNRRRIIVFRLRPAGHVQYAKKDVVSRAPTDEIKQVSASVTTALIEPDNGKKGFSKRSAQPHTMSQHRKNELIDAYYNFLKARDHEIFAYQIRPAGTTSVLKTDLYDATSHVLYAIKGSCSREEIRMAIGQLKDYQRHIDPANPQTAIVLPDEPNRDLRDLLAAENIALIHQDEGGFAGDLFE